MVKVFALFTVETFGVVRAFTTAVHHVRALFYSVQRQTARSVAVARARTAHNHVVDGVVILFLDFLPDVQLKHKNNKTESGNVKNAVLTYCREGRRRACGV